MTILRKLFDLKGIDYTSSFNNNNPAQNFRMEYQ